MRRWIRAGVLSAALLLPAAALGAEVVYREGFGPPRTPEKMLVGSLLLGRDGVWKGKVEAGHYVLENRDDVTAVRYNYLTAEGKYDLAQANVTVTVEARGLGTDYGVGLLYDFDTVSRSYLAFTVADGKYQVFRRRPSGVRRIAAGKIEGLNAETPTKLVLAYKDDKLHFFVARERVVSIRHVPASAGARNPDRGVGIIAVGRGRFRFDDFAVSIN